MSLLDDGAAWLLARSQEAAGKVMTYVRGSARTSITGVRRATSEAAEDENGIPVAVRRHSIVVGVSQIDFEPRAGDRIEESVGGSTTTWEVLPPATGQPCFRWWDRGRTAHLIDVAQVGD